MTGEQWQELVEWIAERFPDSQWHAEQAVAFFFDLQDYDASDVWAGVFALYEGGLKFAPTGSELVAATRKKQLDKRYSYSYPKLPPEHRAGSSLTWDEYTEKRFGEVQTAQQVIERLHAERPPCGNGQCILHYPVAPIGGSE